MSQSYVITLYLNRVHGGEPEPAMAMAKANYRIFNGNRDGREKPEYLILVTKSMRKELDILHEANKLKVQGTKILGVGMSCLFMLGKPLLQAWLLPDLTLYTT